MIELTKVAKAESEKLTVEMSTVVKIDGYDKLFTSASIKEILRFDDPDLFFDDPDLYFDGYTDYDNQANYMNYGSGGTTTKIQQKLSPDRAQGSSISSMTISLIDKNEEVSQLISPGFDLEDILGRDILVMQGFVNTSYPEDYNTIFRGIVSDVESGPGYINLLLSSSEEKKRRPLITEGTTELDGALTSGSITSFTVVDASLFPEQVDAPEGSPDSTIEYLAKIDDEIFYYETISGNTLNGVQRAYLDSIAAAHDDETDVEHGIRLTGNGIDIALKIMLSGSGYFVEDVPVENIGAISPLDYVNNAIFFSGINVKELYGLTPGDWITLSGATYPSNDFTMRQIEEVEVTELGSYVIVNGSDLTAEFDSDAVVKFRSKYDSYGIGLRMKPSEVDVERHEFIRDTFLSTFQFDFALFSVPITKDFIEQEIYLPMACFSIPRQGKSSVGYTIGPLATNLVPILDQSNVKNANSLRVKRSIASNFANVIQYSYDYDILEEKFNKVKDYISEESKTRIPIGDKILRIKSTGMKTSLSADALSLLASDRMLGRYKYGAEFINDVKLLFSVGYPLEIGDVVLVDYGDLQLTDIDTGNRDGSKKYMEIINKSLDNKTGEVSVDLVNTSFELFDRYGVVSPSSKIDTGATTIKLPLKKSWGTSNYSEEDIKWRGYEGQEIIVHSPDWTFQEVTTIKSLGNNSMLVNPALSVAPSEDYIIDVNYYPDSTDAEENSFLKAMHAFFSPNVSVVNGSNQNKFIVSPVDIDKFFVGSIVRINNEDYSEYSDEYEVTLVNNITYEVEINGSVGFVIDSDHFVKLIGFADHGYSYRII